MPPKAPNLKFKPKLVLGEEETTARSLATQSTDDLSLVQLARLQGLYIGEQALSASGAVTGSGDRLTLTSSSSGRVGSNGGRGGVTGSSSTPCEEQPRVSCANGLQNEDGKRGTVASSLLRPKSRGHNLSAHAALEEASRRHVDVSQYPETAPPLPQNSMNAIVSSSVSQWSGSTHSGLYVPLPLDATLPTRFAAEERGDLSSAQGAVGGAPRSPSAAPMDVDGTAFLREAELEQERTFAANMRFYEEILRPMQTVVPSAAVAPGGLVWMQLPRFHENAPFSFFNLPPGKVGEMKVLRSGRMVLEIAGVYYDVAVEGYEDAGNDGACATAVATQSSAYPSNPSSKPSCYELGLLQKKLICTPTLP
ncbi:putative RNA polymerase III RPC4 [Leishmania naiffi]|uniref:RNA polymerase III RPC4 n=1 Tax=Leishmania naiffi TaxID=5678 RepID=A0AAW3B961_9TRYP